MSREGAPAEGRLIMIKLVTDKDQGRDIGTGGAALSSADGSSDGLFVELYISPIVAPLSRLVNVWEYRIDDRWIIHVEYDG